MSKMVLGVLRWLVGLFFILVLFGFRIDGYGLYKPIFNIFTLYHFLLGVGLGLVAFRPRLAIILVIAWEIVEQLWLVPLGLCYPPELLLDSVLDMIVALGGYLIARWMMRR